MLKYNKLRKTRRIPNFEKKKNEKIAVGMWRIVLKILDDYDEFGHQHYAEEMKKLYPASKWFGYNQQNISLPII